MSNGKVKGTKKLSSSNTGSNSATFLVDQRLKATVNTAEVMSINKADQTGTDGAAGYASATPLVCPVDGFNNALPPATISKMPFYRPQAGKAAIIMDPQPGDKAVAVFMQRDSSGVASGKNDPIQPASFRSFDQADGWLFNGFLGVAPEIWLHLNPVSGDISLSTKAANIDISCRESGDIEIKTAAGNITADAKGDITVNATGTATVKTPQIVLDGNVRVTGNLTVEGISHGPGGGAFQTTGGINNEGGVISSNSVTLDGHTHSGIQPGSGNTQSPNRGT